MASLAIVFAIAALGVVDLAHIYNARRSLQNVADLAALAAAQQMDDSCSQPTATAAANAATNGFVAASGTSSLSVVCGRWDQSGQVTNPPVMSFTPNGSTPWNGVAVTVTNTVPYFFLGPKRTITATATAQATIVGSFSLATTLVQANLLNGLLGSLLGSSVNLSLVSWNGIANANIKVADLAAVATNAGTVNGLLDAQASVAGIAQLVAKAVQNDGVLTADVQAAVAGLNLFATAASKQSTQITLASQNGAPALLSLGLANAQSAANASVNALQMLIVAAEIAQAGKPPVAVNLSLTSLPVISALLPASASLSVNVLSPPSIAIGEAGPDPANPTQWRTQAHNSQITVALNLGFGQQSLLGQLVTLNVPLYVEVAQATAGLEAAQCAPTRADSRMTVSVLPGIANLCVGTPGAAGSFSGGTCSGSPGPLLSVAGGLISAQAALSLQLVKPQSVEMTFDGNGTALSGNQANTNQIGGALGNGLSSLASQLGNPNNLQVTVLGINLGGITSALASLITSLLPTQLLNALDQALLGPLLQLLGVQVGVADVSAFPLTCGVAQIVQ